MLNIALLQMNAHGSDQSANQRKGEAFCRRAAQMGADIALFPEMWNIGYSFFDAAQPGAREQWAAQAITHTSAFVYRFQALAQELEMAIALTYLEKWNGLPRNTVALIDRCGDIVMTYAKVHTCDFGDECALTPGDDFYVCDLDTAQGVVKIGAMICYDREFPESARILMLKGAELILVPNACEIEINRLSQLRARAYENMVGIAMTNYAAPQDNGHSVAFDGVAYTLPPNGGDGASRDMLIVEAGEQESVYLAPFDLEMLRRYRAHEVHGNSYRKPSRYGLLVSDEVAPPFVRADARR
ncbi:MAG: carbon-nitrogen hydrolase family protein [Anaerolineae bacterium]